MIDIGAPPPRRRRLPKVLIVLGILAALVIAAVFTAFAFTSGAVKEADSFLQINARQGPDAAWRRASPGFQAATTVEGWAALSKARGLGSYTGASWSRRAISGHEATLGGTIALADGARVPAEMTLVEGPSGWQVQSVGFAAAGASTAPGIPANTIAGENIANACRDILAQSGRMHLDSATCPSIAAVKGAVAECTASRGNATGRMRVTIDSVAADGNLNLDCEANLGPSGH